MAQLVVDGVVQSVLPPPDWGYWKHMVPDTEPKNVLMLGVGLGTTAQMILDKWPKAQIRGVDNYRINNHKGVDVAIEFILSDAFERVDMEIDLPYTAGQADRGYDLVIVDLWSGGWYPTQVFKTEFIAKLKRLLSPDGKIYINAPNIEKCAKLNNLKVRGESEGESIVYETT